MPWTCFLVVLLLACHQATALRFACDPCVTRSAYIIQAFVHGTTSDPYWQQLSASAHQAALDMGVQFELQLYETYNPQLLAQDIRNAATSLTRRPNRPDAMIVSIPTAAVAESVAFAIAQGIPCFGIHSGYGIAPAEMMGFVAQDEYVAGQLAGYEFVQQLLVSHGDNHNGTRIEVIPRDDDDLATTDPDNDGRRALAQQLPSHPTRQLLDNKMALFIHHEAGNPTFGLRMEGFQRALDPYHAVSMDEVVIDPQDVIGRVTKINEALRGCEYDFVLIGGAASVEVTLAAIHDNGCRPTTLAGTFDTSPTIYSALLQGDLVFALSQQAHLQGALSVVLASIYVTTGKGLPLRRPARYNAAVTPLRATNNNNDEQQLLEQLAQDNATAVAYTSGPSIIRKDTIPSDTQQACEVSAFPVCHTNPNNNDMVEPLALPMGSPNKCNCVDRSKIRIGGVVHGTTTDNFWDSVFAAAEEAALDQSVMLEMERFGPTKDHAIIEQKMASKIKSLCEGGISGLFVTIPSDAVTDAIQLCLDLEIPVISINAGAEQSKQLGLLTHIGQNEYKTGYEAGKRLLEAGISRGFCLNHLPGVVAMEERCSGFRDAIQQAERGRRDLSYGGMIVVPPDHDEQYILAVESKIGSDGNANGIGLLVTGASQLSGALKIKAKYKSVVIGIFDVWDQVFEPLDRDDILFAVDQQPSLQGSLPVHLLAYQAYTSQALISPQIETGPAAFVERSPSRDEQICEANLYQVCRAAREEENLNYISDYLVWLGFSLSLITILMAIACIGWTLFYQGKSDLVAASQPPFLIIIALGAIVSSVAINTLSVQTDYRVQVSHSAFGGIASEPNPEIGFVDGMCMATPWLFGAGFVLMFSALFAKIIRVKLIYDAGRRMRRQTVGIRDVSWIFFRVIAVEFALLLSWQLVSPFKWQREVTLTSAEGMPLESVGECTSDKGWYFLLGLLLFHVVCLFYALALCFQTKDLPTKFSESSYVSLAVMCIFQVSVLVLPVGAMVRDSPDAFYFVQACAIFLQNFTVLCLIFGPKMIKVATGEDAIPATYAASSRALGRRNSHVTDYSKMSSGRIEDTAAKTDSPGGKRISFWLDKDCDDVCAFDREKSGEFLTLIKCPRCSSYFEERIPLFTEMRSKDTPATADIADIEANACGQIPDPGADSEEMTEQPAKRDSRESVDSFYADSSHNGPTSLDVELTASAAQFPTGLSDDDNDDREVDMHLEEEVDLVADKGEQQDLSQGDDAEESCSG